MATTVIMVNHEPNKQSQQKWGGTNLEGGGNIFSIIICIMICISQASAEKVAAPDAVVNLKSSTLNPKPLATYYIIYPKPNNFDINPEPLT
jgi:hypothetical protein